MAEALVASARAELDRRIPPALLGEGASTAYLLGAVHGAARALRLPEGTMVPCVPHKGVGCPGILRCQQLVLRARVGQ
jgi:hypothetical protein